MIRKIFFLGLASLFGIILMQSFSNNGKNPTGAPAGQTGSPGDGSSCAGCHGTTAGSIAGVITTNIPSSGYLPGNTYTITVTLPGSGNKGFELSPQNLNGDQKGTLVAGTNTQTLNNGKYITHNNAISAPTAVWTFQWIAPSAGSGDLKLFAACVISKPNVYLTNVQVSESTSGLINNTKEIFSIFPNPVVDKVNVKFSRTVSDAQISIYDLSGRQILHEQNINDSQHTIHISHLLLKKGIYILVVNIGDNQYFKKIIKE